MASIKLRSNHPRRTLDDIFSEPDELGLLDHLTVTRSATRIDQSRFEEINQFIDTHHREPSPAGELSEKSLARRLAAFRKDPGLYDGLQAYDRHGLLTKVSPNDSTSELELISEGSVSQEISEVDESSKSLDDIFNSDAFGVLGADSASDIFDLQNVAAVRSTPEEIAERKSCEDFFRFKPMFDELHDKIKNNQVVMARFEKSGQIRVGDFYILKGMACFIDEIGEDRFDTEGRYDPRLRLIFDNGAESNMLLRSLSKRLWEDKGGKRVIPDESSVVDAFQNISHKDKPTGQIYIVSSLSDKEPIRSMRNLYKIGFTQTTVEQRVKNSVNDTTFLEAPVRIITAFDCYNLNPHKFETLIHGFLHAQKLQITLIGKNGSEYHPSEWFIVELDAAKEVVRRIIDGSIVNFRMDNTTGRIVRK